MSFFAGLSSGYNNAQAEHNKKLFDMDQKRFENLSGMYAHLADMPDLPPEVAAEYRNRAFSFGSVDPRDPKSRKTVKKMENAGDPLLQYHDSQVANYHNSLVAPSAQANPETGKAAAPITPTPPTTVSATPPIPERDEWGRRNPAYKTYLEVEAKKAIMKAEREGNYEAADELKKRFPNLSDRDLAAVSTGHGLPSAPSQRTQAKQATIKLQDGSTVDTWVVFDPFAKANGGPTYTDAQGNPVDVVSVNQGVEEEGLDRDFKIAAGALYGDENHPLTEQQKQNVELRRKRRLNPMSAGPMYPVVTNGPNGPMVTRAQGTEAAGMPVPQTLYDPTGVGQTAGMPVTTSPPPTIPDTLSADLTSWELHKQAATDVLKELHTYKGALGPIWGNIAKLQLSKLGGAGTTPETRQMAVKLSQLLTYKAFSMGGKQLTPTELDRFEELLPKMDNTVESAVTKTENAIAYANEAVGARVKNISPRIRQQLPASLSTAPVEDKPTRKIGWDEASKLFYYSDDGGQTWQRSKTRPK